MAKDKLRRWEENKLFSHVFEPDLIPIIKNNETFMKGEWRSYFGNDCPIVLELGCGKGEYTVGLAKIYPHKNFIGIDVKGHRFNKGARLALDEGLSNVAFLRTRIEFIQAFFNTDEVDEIWLTFSDPQPQDKTGVRRLTSKYYLQKYADIIKAGGIIHIKHDNDEVYRLALLEFGNDDNFNIETHTDDLYGSYFETLDDIWKYILGIRTHYEQIWLKAGRTVKYMRICVNPRLVLGENVAMSAQSI